MKAHSEPVGKTKCKKASHPPRSHTYTDHQPISSSTASRAASWTVCPESSNGFSHPSSRPLRLLLQLIKRIIWLIIQLDAINGAIHSFWLDEQHSDRVLAAGRRSSCSPIGWVLTASVSIGVRLWKQQLNAFTGWLAPPTDVRSNELLRIRVHLGNSSPFDQKFKIQFRMFYWIRINLLNFIHLVSWFICLCLLNIFTKYV